MGRWCGSSDRDPEGAQWGTDVVTVVTGHRRPCPQGVLSSPGAVARSVQCCPAMLWRSWLVVVALGAGCGSADSNPRGDDGGTEDDGDAGGPDGDGDAPDGDGGDGDGGGGSDDGPPAGTVSAADCELEGVQILGESFETDDVFGAERAFAIQQLEVDENFVYFADRWGLQRVPLGGGMSERIVEDGWPFADGMVLHGGNLVWTRNTEAGWELQTAAATGGATTMLTPFDGYTHWLRTDGTTLIWSATGSGVSEGSRIYALAPGATSPTVLAKGRYGWSADIDFGNVYATGYLPDTDPGAGAQVVFRLPVDGGSATVLADDFGDNRPSKIVAGVQNVYYVVADASQPVGVQYVAKSGGEPAEMNLGDAPVPDTLVSGDGHVVGFNVRGEVWLLREEGTPVHLTTTDNQLYPGDVAIHGDTALVMHHAHECLEFDQVPDEHTGSTFEVCRRSITRRCIEAVTLP